MRAGAKTLALDRTAGFSFSFSVRTGVFRGNARMEFESGRMANGSYFGVVAPGWVLPCECGIVAPEMPFGCGSLQFTDVVGGKAVKRSLSTWLDKDK